MPVTHLVEAGRGAGAPACSAETHLSGLEFLAGKRRKESRRCSLRVRATPAYARGSANAHRSRNSYRAATASDRSGHGIPQVAKDGGHALPPARRDESQHRRQDCPRQVKSACVIVILSLAALPLPLQAQTGDNVLLVENRKSPLSHQIAEYYRPRRSVPPANTCYLDSPTDEEIDWPTYQKNIELPVGNCLTKAGLQEKVLYIVLTAEIPLKIAGTNGTLEEAEQGSVDSELTLLYGKLKGSKFLRKGSVNNPFFGKRDAPFRHPQLPIYLVTRLAAYDWTDVKGMIDRSLAAHNRGQFVIDLKSPDDEAGNDWLRNAAILLPTARVTLDEGNRVLYDQKNVVGFASWGSNDRNRKHRWLGFQWLPGGIATEFVSTNMRTLKRPPDDWTYTTWQDHDRLWADSPQGLTADLIHEGATGASGNVYEPYLAGCARPDYVLPAYFEGRNLAESFYLGIAFLSWQGVVLGDPLCSLGNP